MALSRGIGRKLTLDSYVPLSIFKVNLVDTDKSDFNMLK